MKRSQNQNIIKSYSILPVFLGLGVGLGALIGNIGVGLAIGAGIGTVASLLVWRWEKSRRD